MTRIAIAGAGGRMGRTLAVACEQVDDLLLTQALERSGNPTLGSDIGVLAGLPSNGILIGDSLEADQFDLLIDFTHPLATREHLEFCLKHKKKMVIGTTGCGNQLEQEIRAAGEHIALLHAANMSVGVNLCFKLLQTAAAVLGDQVDIEIIEAHHRHKVDAPSGTALEMGRVIANTLERDLEKVAVYGREGQTGPRERGTIGFETIRAGDIVGEHTVLFADEGERVEITHKASSRMNFASGAMRACRWIANKDKGFFSMQDVLDLN